MYKESYIELLSSTHSESPGVHERPTEALYCGPNHARPYEVETVVEAAVFNKTGTLPSWAVPSVFQTKAHTPGVEEFCAQNWDR